MEWSWIAQTLREMQGIFVHDSSQRTANISVLRIQRTICRRVNSSDARHTYRFVFVVSRHATNKWVDTGRVEETGIVAASMWLETLELSLSREWRPRIRRTHSAGSATAILLTASPSECLRHLFQICRIQFIPVTMCICIPRAVFAPPFQLSFLFFSTLLSYCRSSSLFLAFYSKM